MATQVYPRKQDYQVISALAGLGGSLYKFAFDLRLLAIAAARRAERAVRPAAGRLIGHALQAQSDQRREDQLAGRLLAQMPRLAWDNAAHSLLERTLDDSANRRSLLPEAFLIADELLLSVTARCWLGLQVDQDCYAAQPGRSTAPLRPSSALLMALGKAGADRQAMHERLRQHAMKAWDAIQAGEAQPAG